MTWFTILQLITALAGGLVTALTKAGAPTEIIADAQAAQAAFARVLGSEVTKGQLDAATFTPQW